MNSLAICLLLLSAFPKSNDAVESVRQEWVKKFSQDPEGQVEIFRVPDGRRGSGATKGVVLDSSTLDQLESLRVKVFRDFQGSATVRNCKRVVPLRP